MKDMPEVLLLCGFSGSGKTETGKILAEKIGYDFVDTDQVVEDHFGKTIPEIFMQLGEGKFRFAESDVVRMAAKRSKIVIALGGGTMGDEHAVAYLKSCGHLIYLKVLPETVYERLQDSDMRPMLKALSGTKGDEKEAAMSRIKSLLETRTPFYLEANDTIDTDSKTPTEVAAEIMDSLSKDG